MKSQPPPSHFPPEAYAPDGTLWWELEFSPGTKRPYGGERKISAWLAFNVPVGGSFTMKNLRDALGSREVPNQAEHLNRRLRRLRQEGWQIDSHSHDPSLPTTGYRLKRFGWHPGLGTPRPPNEAISQRVRREVFTRDGHRCVICGVGSTEPYPEDGELAVMTIGHRVARDLGGSSSDPSNLQTECKRCNEPVRQQMSVEETLETLMPDVQDLGKGERQKLLDWLKKGQRVRDRLDGIYDRARMLSAEEKEELVTELESMLKAGTLE